MTYWEESEFYDRAIEVIDRWASYDWRDGDEEATVRAVLRRLRSRGQLDGKALVAEMKKRGHSAQALRLLNQYIEETFREPAPDPNEERPE